MSEIRSNIEGVRDLQRKLEALERTAEATGDKPEIPLAELFPPDFLRKHTRFVSLDDMLQQSGFKIESLEDFDDIPADERNGFVTRHTQFSNWEQMVQVAAAEWALRKLDREPED